MRATLLAAPSACFLVLTSCMRSSFAEDSTSWRKASVATQRRFSKSCNLASALSTTMLMSSVAWDWFRADADKPRLLSSFILSTCCESVKDNVRSSAVVSIAESIRCLKPSLMSAVSRSSLSTCLRSVSPKAVCFISNSANFPSSFWAFNPAFSVDILAADLPASSPARCASLTTSSSRCAKEAIEVCSSVHEVLNCFSISSSAFLRSDCDGRGSAFCFCSVLCATPKASSATFRAAFPASMAILVSSASLASLEAMDASWSRNSPETASNRSCKATKFLWPWCCSSTPRWSHCSCTATSKALTSFAVLVSRSRRAAAAPEAVCVVASCSSFSLFSASVVRSLCCVAARRDEFSSASLCSDSALLRDKASILFSSAYALSSAEVSLSEVFRTALLKSNALRSSSSSLCAWLSMSLRKLCSERCNLLATSRLSATASSRCLAKLCSACSCMFLMRCSTWSRKLAIWASKCLLMESELSPHCFTTMCWSVVSSAVNA
mmetsp:Transcript_20232/g.47218  ORF Transcript_20232/g.47218 Transcript_20232/m.47218 type:complete len:495 (-) Transcript_20232:1762-3246(-)